MTGFWLQPRTIAVYAVSLLALAEIIDLTIVGVSIPQIMGSIGANLNEVSLATTSYIVAAAIFIPLTGIFIRKFGIKRLTLVSTILFGVSSLLCGTATSLPQLVFFRIMQGIGGAFLPAIAQTYIAQNFNQTEQPKIMSIYSLCVVMGPVIGPIFGGVITEHLSWRWCFYVNAPICLAGFILAVIYMKDNITENIKVDYISFIFIAAGIGLLEYFIDEGNIKNWFDSIEMIVVLTFSIIMLGFFFWRNQLGKSVINLGVFKDSNFSLCCLSMFIFVIMMSASMAYFPTLLQQTYGYPVNLAGFITAPRGMIAFILAPILAWFIRKVDPRQIMFIGLLIYAASSFMLAKFGPTANQSSVLIITIIQGAGMMGFFIPIMQIVFINVPMKLHGDASGIFNFFRNFGSSVGTSIAATLIAHESQVAWHDMASHVSPYSRGYQLWSQNLLGTTEQNKIAIAQSVIEQQSSLISYIDSFYLFGIALLLIFWLPFILKRPDKSAPIVNDMH